MNTDRRHGELAGSHSTDAKHPDEEAEMEIEQKAFLATDYESCLAK